VSIPKAAQAKWCFCLFFDNKIEALVSEHKINAAKPVKLK
jgi:hypothetical protein